MRYFVKNRGVSVQIIAGTYVVSIGMDATDKVRANLLGFAIHRSDNTEHEQYWLTGFRTFVETYKNPPPGALVSTQEHPIQDFLWSDFTAKPNHSYTYKIVPVSGKPKDLVYGPAVEIDVQTESEVKTGHDIYFNRGVIGSQAYAREFKNADPSKLSGAAQKAALTWLSRGLEEAMIDFIGQANAREFGLRAAVYEFSFEPAAEAFAQAQGKCKDVQIVYDARITGSGKKKTEMQQRVTGVKTLLKKYGLDKISTPRTEGNSYIAHNKFVILLQQGKPIAVWTGSTNFTESGIYGQSNVGHTVRDPAVAQAYLDYWTRLQKDPGETAIRTENMSLGPDFKGYPPSAGVTPVFSPRKGIGMLQWYADAISHADQMVCFTAAFGVNELILDVFKGKQNRLNYIFLEKWGVNRTLADACKKALGADVNNQVAVGNYLEKNVLTEYLQRRWVAERSNSLAKNVRFTHNKFLLIDPLGEDPVVITGSANFSDASTTNNDENMLVIRGDKRVADIYLGEFMRLWRHYRFRYIVNEDANKGGNSVFQPNYLDPTPAWTNPYYKPGTVAFRKRKAFAGLAAVTA